MTGCVYGLVDPRSNVVRYVGRTQNKAKKRYHQHVADARNATGELSRKQCWIRILFSMGLKPRLVILEDCPVKPYNKNFDMEWAQSLRRNQRTENTWIQALQDFGFPLTNVGGGKRGWVEVTDEQKSAILSRLKELGLAK